MTFSLELPRETLSIPVIRQVLGDTLRTLGVEGDCVSDILIATSEACTNALRYGGPGRRYEVAVRIGTACCVLKIMDTGGGFDPATVGATRTDAEGGRGFTLMRALVDDVDIDSVPDRGTSICLHKQLVWADDAALPRLEPEPV